MGIEERKLCIHCCWHDAPKYSAMVCIRPGAMLISPVDGKPAGPLCELERATFGGCGLGGEFYEAKQ